MMVKRYVVKDMPEAILQIRKDLGKDAVILSTKRLTVSKWMGLWRTRKIEVLAAVGDDVPLQVNLPKFSNMPTEFAKSGGTGASQHLPSSPSANDSQISMSSAAYPASRPAVQPVTHGNLSPGADGGLAEAGTIRDGRAVDLSKMMEELSAIKDMLGTALLQQDVGLSGLAQRLIDQGMHMDRVLQLITDPASEGVGVTAANRQVSSDDVEALQHLLKSKICAVFLDGKVSEPISPEARVVAFVGPTGVGKTTTVAKIAALHVLAGTRRVGLVTTDTFRIAAVDQLRTYASILNVPLEVAYQPSDLPTALARLSQCDLILLDTAGRNYRVESYLDEVESILGSIRVDETYLVLSMTSKPQDLDEVTAKFCRLPVDKFLFTKLDETSTYGTILDLLLAYRKPMSYLTTGQNVPDDIEVASLEKVLKLILGGAA
ncbi:MAG: flagellar biosynthesis protein FlhF [Alicyclobacillus sp.]|nr:flagellar biosynthesis protein FlhF [Alicyclobacillus sp.]